MSTIDEEMVMARFIVSGDVERSRRFYTDVLGGRTVISGEADDEVTYVALANSWIIINIGGGPTDDKPTVTLETPPDPDRVSSFLNIRVADIQAVYAQWSARGAQFLTPPKQHETEVCCYIRDPDGYLIEVGQTTLPRGWRPPSRDADHCDRRGGPRGIRRTPRRGRVVRRAHSGVGAVHSGAGVGREDSSGVIAHVMLSWVGVEGGSRTRILNLTPMSVRPDRQRIGVGARLIRDALGRAEDERSGAPGGSKRAWRSPRASATRPSAAPTCSHPRGDLRISRGAARPRRRSRRCSAG